MRFLFCVTAVLMLLPAASSADVSTPKLLADRPSAHCQAPRWSPDGKQLAYDVYNPKKDTREVWIVPISGSGSPDTGAMKEVTPGRSRATALLSGKKAPVVELAWAPDMNMLSKPFIFSALSPKKNFDLFVDGSWLTSNSGNDGQPAWADFGEKRFIAYASQRKAGGDVYVIDIMGDQTPKRVTMWQNATEYGPRWAPGKPYLMFTRSSSGNKGQDIGLVMDVNRPKDTMKMVTEWRGDEIRPAWSPDARRVAFYSNKDNRKNDKIFDLWVVGVDGKNAKKLARDVVVDDHQGPAWTPDGSTVLYVKRDFKVDNPVRWVKADGSASGTLDTGTQLNSDLVLHDRGGGNMALAFKALGQKGSTDKTWERLYLVTFSINDLQPAQE